MVILKVAVPFLYFLTYCTPFTVLGNMLDGTILSTILLCLEKHFAPELVLEYLENIIMLPRFNIVSLFLKSSEKQGMS